MAIILRRYPVRAIAVVEPFYTRRDILNETEDLLTEYLSKPDLLEFSFGNDLTIEEKKDKLIVKGELPGFKKGDMDISVKGDTLTVKGERKEEKELKEEGVYSYRSSYGSYYRELTLPSHIDGKSGSFKLTKGKLEIKLPGAAKASQRQIKIKAQAPKKKQVKAGTAKSK